MRALLILVLTLGATAPARADELTVAHARRLGHARDREAAIETLLHGALTDRPRLRRAIRRSLVRLGGLSAEAAARLPSRARLLTWLARELHARDLSMTMVYMIVVAGEPSPGTLRISAIPEACDDDFYVWADVDLGADGWTLVGAGIGDDC